MIYKQNCREQRTTEELINTMKEIREAKQSDVQLAINEPETMDHIQVWMERYEVVLPQEYIDFLLLCDGFSLGDNGMYPLLEVEKYPVEAMDNAVMFVLGVCSDGRLLCTKDGKLYYEKLGKYVYECYLRDFLSDYITYIEEDWSYSDEMYIEMKHAQRYLLRKKEKTAISESLSSFWPLTVFLALILGIWHIMTSNYEGEQGLMHYYLYAISTVCWCFSFLLGILSIRMTRKSKFFVGALLVMISFMLLYILIDSIYIDVKNPPVEICVSEPRLYEREFHFRGRSQHQDHSKYALSVGGESFDINKSTYFELVNKDIKEMKIMVYPESRVLQSYSILEEGNTSGE
ncbi:MAG: hypothetical protein Q4D51_11515 [Eubacteriales bacterium]|nr:hypothetical protein [Eubacteriales bacterium]